MHMVRRNGWILISRARFEKASRAITSTRLGRAAHDDAGRFIERKMHASQVFAYHSQREKAARL